MFDEDFVGSKIASKFGSEKVIVGVKDKSFSLLLLDNYLWALLLVISLGLLFNFGNLSTFLTQTEFVLVIIAFIIVSLASILTFLGSLHKVYFKDNLLICENMLKMKKTIDLDKFPRAYIRQHISSTYLSNPDFTGDHYLEEREDYIFYIEQDSTLIKLKTRFRNVENFINNLITKER